ncbi:MAG: MiaB/RimO family radical SAM methylthiotransferase [Chloroflexota bacterium]
MPHYHIWTIGCQMNKAESERLASLFEQRGYLPTTTPQKADIILLNSCVVRQSAENRVINRIAILKTLKKQRPELILVVTGCLVDSDTEHLKKKFPYVDHFFKAGGFPPWLAQIERPALPHHPSPAVYVPIMQGCNNFCSYCIVPYRRGREISRPLDEISTEVTELVKSGAREVTLLGQNVDSYGHNLPDLFRAKSRNQPDLADLLKELNSIDGLSRIRFLTNHPKDMSKKLINAVATLDNVCEQLSLPVQSGNNEILKLMKRGYTIEHYRRLINEIRDKISGVAISTDIIVGFPGETNEQFEDTVNLLSDLKFDMVHVAAYSPRPGTTAARELEDNVSAAEKKRRLDTIERLQESIVSEINAKLLNKTVEVLVEGRKEGKWFGRTRTDKLVFFPCDNICPAQLVNIKIEKTSPWALQGKVKSDKTSLTNSEH